MNEITAGEPFFLWLGFYVISLLLPSIPLSLAYVFRSAWRLNAQERFIHHFVALNQKNGHEWDDKKIKGKKSSILSSEGTQAIFDFIEYLWDLLSFFLSVIFNIIALALVVEKLFLVAFCLSLFLAYLAMKLRRPRQRQLTEKALTARVELAQTLLTAWDHLFGEESIFNGWNRKLNQRIQNSQKRNIKLERFDQLMAIIISLIVNIPSLTVVVWFAIKHSGDTAKLAPFFVTIPTLFVILRYTYQLLSESFRFNMHKSKLNSIFKAIQPKDIAIPQKIAHPEPIPLIPGLEMP